LTLLKFARLRACDAAVAVLQEHKQPGIMYGDEWLCHQVAKKMGWESEGPMTSRRVLAALAKTPGLLIKTTLPMPSDCCARGQSVLHFELPEHLRAKDEFSKVTP
jgi:hypothetical protein